MPSRHDGPGTASTPTKLLHLISAPAAASLALMMMMFTSPAVRAETENGIGAAGLEQHAWWRELGDDRLARLIDSGIDGNLDLDAAWARVQQADARSRQALAALLPSVRLDANANAAPFDSLGFQFGGLPFSSPGDDENPEVYFTGSAALKAQLEADVFGRQSLLVSASRYDAQAQRGDRAAQVLALASRIAQAYYDIASADEQLALLTEQRKTNAALLELLELRYRRGEGSALAVLQQRQQLAATDARVPQSRLLKRVRVEELATLLGREELAEEWIAAARIPEPAPLSGDSELGVDRRPDLRAARLRVRASTARSSSAVRALLPSVRASGQAGVDARFLDELSSQGSWGAGLSLSVPLFEGGRNYARIDEAEALARASLDSYEQLALKAKQEIRSARSQAEEQRNRLQALERQAEIAQVTFKEARARYLAGLDSYLDVLGALGTLQQTQLGLVQARRDLISTRIQFYTAVGGPLSRPGDRGPA